jgi:hypothetical protein
MWPLVHGFHPFVRPLLNFALHTCSFFVARSSVIASLSQNLREGFLKIHDDAEVFQIGKQSEAAGSVCIRVNDENFWQRLFLFGDVGCESFRLLLRVSADTRYQSASHTWQEKSILTMTTSKA